MNSDTEDALEELMKLFPLREGCSDAFDAAVSELALLADPEAIPAILDLADETCELSGLMDSLMESLEVYPEEEYVPRFLAALPGFARRNPRLARKAVATMLWSPSHLRRISELTPTLPPLVKRALRRVLLELSAPEDQRAQLLAIL